MTSSPPGLIRVIWILTRAGLRRWLNRFTGQMRLKKKPQPEAPVQRGATPRKGRGGKALLVFAAAMMLSGSFFISAQFLGKLAVHVQDEQAPAGLVPVPPEAYEDILQAEEKLKALASQPSDTGTRRGFTSEDQRRRILEDLERSLSWSHIHGFRLTREQRQARARELLEIFQEKGSTAFRPREDIAFAGVTGNLWPDPADRPFFLRAVGLCLLLLALCQFFTAMGMQNHDLSAVSWSLEWLFTFPVPARGLFLAKACEYALVNALGWFMTFPLLLVLYLAGGFGLGSVPLSLAASLSSFAVLGSLRILMETWLRKSFPAAQVKNVQALFTVAGMIFLIGAYWVALTQDRGIPEPFLDFAKSVPGAVLWNPLSVPALIGAGGLPGLWAAGALILWPLVVALASAVLAERLVRDGLVTTTGTSGGRRTMAAAPAGRAAREWLPRGIVGKEIRLVLRDRNRFVQALIVPLFMLALQLVLNPSLLASAAANFQHAATLAFAVGSWMLAFTAFQVLVLEGNALWILYTLPRELHSLLLAKTLLWAALASSYTALVLAAAAFTSPTLGLEEVGVASVAIAGVALHAFIAAGLGILSSDPLETEPARKVNPVVLYLYFFIAALLANAIYAPSAWTKIAQLVLSSALAYALWQKVRDRIPYLLDPTEAPPPRLSLADGLIAALAFFALQSVLGVLFLRGEVPPGASIFYAFTVAGALVGLLSLYVFWRMKVPDLLDAVGLRFPRGPNAFEVAFKKAFLIVLAAGAAAAGIGLLYLRLVDQYEPLRRLKEETLAFKDHLGPNAVVWVEMLAVVAAPIFEEYIFRGLVYRGMRRSAGVLPSVLLSAALFAIVHPPISVLPVFCLGILCALVMERAGNLLAPILVHAIYNAVMVAAN